MYTRENPYSHELMPYALSNYIFIKKCCHKWSKLMSFSSWCLKQNFRGINWGSVWPFIVMNRINMLFQTTFLSRIVITNCAPKIFLIFMNCCYMLFQITFFQSQMEQFYVFLFSWLDLLYFSNWLHEDFCLKINKPICDFFCHEHI